MIGLLITIFLVVQPFFAFAQAMPYASTSSMAAVYDKETSHAHGMHAAEHVNVNAGMACGELSQQDCSIASSGACSGLTSALVSQSLFAPLPLTSDQEPSDVYPHYLSVVLDSLNAPT